MKVQSKIVGSAGRKQIGKLHSITTGGCVVGGTLWHQSLSVRGRARSVARTLRRPTTGDFIDCLRRRLIRVIRINHRAIDAPSMAERRESQAFR